MSTTLSQSENDKKLVLLGPPSPSKAEVSVLEDQQPAYLL